MIIFGTSEGEDPGTREILEIPRFSLQNMKWLESREKINQEKDGWGIRQKELSRNFFYAITKALTLIMFKIIAEEEYGSFHTLYGRSEWVHNGGAYILKDGGVSVFAKKGNVNSPFLRFSITLFPDKGV